MDVMPNLNSFFINWDDSIEFPSFNDLKKGSNKIDKQMLIIKFEKR